MITRNPLPVKTCFVQIFEQAGQQEAEHSHGPHATGIEKPRRFSERTGACIVGDPRTEW